MSRSRTLVGGPLCGQDVRSWPSSEVVWCGEDCAPRSRPDDARRHPYRLVPALGPWKRRTVYIFEGHRLRRCQKCGSLVRTPVGSCRLCGADLGAKT